MRLKAARVDELEEKLATIKKDKTIAEEELEHYKCKCSLSDIEALNQKSECDALRSKVVCMEHEMESLKCMCKDKERMKHERDDLKRHLDELLRMQDDFDDMMHKVTSITL